MTGSWQGHAGFGQGTQKLEVCGGKWQGTPWRDIPEHVGDTPELIDYSKIYIKKL